MWYKYLNSLNARLGGSDLHSTGIKVRPCSDELPEMMGPEDGRVPREVVEVVHDDGHKKVQHDEGAEEDEGHKVDVRDVRAAGLVGIKEQARGLVPLVSSLVTRSPR